MSGAPQPNLFAIAAESIRGWIAVHEKDNERAANYAAQSALPYHPELDEERLRPMREALAKMEIFAALTEDSLRAALSEGLSVSEVLVCNRCWSAWGYGTMRDEDFGDASDDDGVLDNIVDSLKKLAGFAPIFDEVAQ